MRKSLGALLGLALFGMAALSSCGDVTSELITRTDTGAGVCRSDADCADGEVCTLPAGSCVPACDETTVCPSTKPVCDEATRLCRGCTSGSECLDFSFETPYCQNGRCVECTDVGHCELPSELCSDVLGECAIPCADGGVCPADEVCDPMIGFCVDCRNDADCDASELCRSHECIEAP